MSDILIISAWVVGGFIGVVAALFLMILAGALSVWAANKVLRKFGAEF